MNLTVCKGQQWWVQRADSRYPHPLEDRGLASRGFSEGSHHDADDAASLARAP